MSRSGDFGFTLLETLAALTITAIGLTCIARMLYGAQQSIPPTRYLSESAVFLKSVMASEVLGAEPESTRRRRWIDRAGKRGWRLRIVRKPEPADPELDRIDITLFGGDSTEPMKLSRWVRR